MRTTRILTGLIAILCGATAAAQAQDPEVLLEEITSAAFPMYAFHAGDERLFISERRGAIRIWTKQDGLLETPFLDIDPLVGAGSERGMYTIAFHPDYPTNPHFFISYYESADERVGVFRYRVSDTNPNLADPNSALRILEVEQPEHIHNGGHILFGPDGYLYLAFGDGNAGDSKCRAQRSEFFLGKILRIDVDQIQDGVPFSYGIPADNPFVGANDPNGRWPDETWATGFRHPWRFSFDPLTGDIFIGDVGASSWEEINRIPAGTRGQNFGWKIMEGNTCRAPTLPAHCPLDTPECFSPDFTPPIWTYSHGTTSGGTEMRGCAAIGGFVYRGDAIPDLYGKYVWTDYCNRQINVLDELSPGNWGNPRLLLKGITVPNSMGLDSEGELYIMNLNKVHKLVPAAGKVEQTTTQQTCIREMNRGAQEMAKARMRANTECVKFAGRRQLHRVDGVAENDLTVAACFGVGLPKRIQRGIDGATRRENGRCLNKPEQKPDFGFTSAGTVIQGGLDAAGRMAEVLLGPDPDAPIVFTDEDRDGARCQERVLSKTQLVYDQHWRRGNQGVSRALRGLILSPARTGEELAEKVLDYVDDDTRTIARAVGQLERDIERHCSEGTPISQLFPGSCALDDPNAFLGCIVGQTRCHYCRQFESSDGVTIDCDAWDDGEVNASCPSEADLLCAAPGAGVNWAAADVNCTKLQDYRLFSNPTDPRSAPNGGGLPFDLTTPLFSDYAQKYRVAFLPPGTAASYDANDPWGFPLGTILAKTFSFAHDLRDVSLGEDIIETRLLIHREFGWVGLPYLWDPNSGEATLSLDGASTDVSWIHTDASLRSTEYQIPSAIDCTDCHQSATESGTAPIGPKARLLNRNYPYAAGSENQLDHWSTTGRLSGAPPSGSAPRLPFWDDPGDGTLEERARAYIESNCFHCHNAAGKAAFVGISFAHDQELNDEYGLCRESEFEGAPGLTFDLVPGDATASIAVFRLESTEDGIKMPELARSVVHEEGAALVRAWIDSLTGSCP